MEYHFNTCVGQYEVSPAKHWFCCMCGRVIQFDVNEIKKKHDGYKFKPLG